MRSVEGQEQQSLCERDGDYLMRMSTFGGLMGGLKDEYLFKNGTVTGHTWTGYHSSYATYTIGTTLKADASVGVGQVYEGANSYVTISADLTKYKYIHFVVTSSNGSPSISVDGTAVSATTGTKTLDISSKTGSKTIYIRSGSVGKTTESGSVSSGITVSQVWLSNK